MHNQKETPIQRLIREKFEGKTPDLVETTLASEPVLLTEDKHNWYHCLDGRAVFVQGKGNYPAHGANPSIRCYHCRTEIAFREEFDKENNKTKRYIPYCPKCEGQESH